MRQPILLPREAGPALAEDRGHRRQPDRAGVFLQASVRHHDLAAAALGRLGVAKKDRVAFLEVVRQQHVHQAGLTLRVNIRHAQQRPRQLTAARDDAHAAGPLGHQHAAVGQKGERPGMHQPAGDGLDVEIAGGGGENLRRRGRNVYGRQQRGGEDKNQSHSGTPTSPASTMRDRARFRKSLLTVVRNTQRCMTRQVCYSARTEKMYILENADGLTASKASQRSRSVSAAAFGNCC